MPSSRRNFIKTAGCLTIGFCLGDRPYRRSLAATPASGFAEQQLSAASSVWPGEGDRINSWLEILADGRIRVLTGKLELGQGIRTAIAQVAAEELEMEMSQVEVTLAETEVTLNEGYTAGSGSIENSAMAVRNAAATARQKLLELASEKMKIPVTELTMRQGKISVKDGTSGPGSGNGARSLTFSEVLEGRQLTDEVRRAVNLKPKENRRLVGKAIPREDISRMVAGEPVYIQDLRFPGMVHARVVRPPAYGAKLLRFNEQVVKDKIPAFLKTVMNGSFLAVITSDEYPAIQAAQLLRENATWSDSPPLPKVSSQQLADYLTSLPNQTQRITEKGDITPLAGNALSGQATSPGQDHLPVKGTLKSRYSKPYIMHGSIGPSCAIALYDNHKLQVWTHSQGVYPLRDSLAAMLQLSAADIHVKGIPGSGCYGHNGADDVAADAALLAVAYPGKPIRLQWSREDEHSWEPYGSAMVMEVTARLDGSGKISHWKYALWSDTHGTRPGGKPNNLLAAQYLEKPFTERPSGFSGGAYRNSEPYYSIPNQQVQAHFFDGPLRTSSLRSLGAYGNLFAIESFMDELAIKAGKDPYEFRLLHLEDGRAKEVIQKLQALTHGQAAPYTFTRTDTHTRTGMHTDSDTHTGMSIGMGMAFSRYENSKAYCAVAARVTVDQKTSAVHVQKMWAVIDAGEVINLDGIKNQVEGSMIQSASWTLLEQVHFDQHHVTNHNWDTYPIFRFNQVPEVEVMVLDRPEEEPLGAGEAAQGPAAAAIVNAIYSACGKRVRHLPVVTALL